MKNRVNALAERLELGAQSLVEFAGSLTEEEWQVQVPRDGRKVGRIAEIVAEYRGTELIVTEVHVGVQGFAERFSLHGIGAAFTTVVNVRSNSRTSGLMSEDNDTGIAGRRSASQAASALSWLSLM